MKPTVLDLFSGIGGMSLGLGRAGFATVAFCEIDPWCRSLLAKHWPNVPTYTDVRDLTAARLRADGIAPPTLIAGGFPCQDISLAGKGAGLDGERSGLWREFRRLIGELRPRFVLVENVGALRGRGLLELLADFASFGYDAEWHAVPAAAVGAPHLRDRVWIVATVADADGIASGQTQALAGVDREGRGTEADGRSASGRKCQRLAQHGDQQGAPGHQPDGLGDRGRRDGPAAAHAPGRGSPQLRGLFGRLSQAITAAAAPWERTPEPPLRRVDDGLPAGLDGSGRPGHGDRTVRRQDRHRVKGLGNAVVPKIPELIGRALIEEFA